MVKVSVFLGDLKMGAVDFSGRYDEHLACDEGDHDDHVTVGTGDLAAVSNFEVSAGLETVSLQIKHICIVAF